VTARRRSENIQTVPVAVTAVLPDKLQQFGTITTDDLNKMAPSLHVYGNNGQHDQLIMTIRGEGLAFNTLFPAVIPYLAEVPVPNLLTGAFFDLENVQVLRGPQGVRFGRVTDGGAVLISPKQPTNEFGGFIEAGAGDYNMYSVTGALNIPIVKDKVLLRLSGDIERRDGSVKNVFDNTDLDNLHSDSARASLVLRPSDRFENYTMFQFQNVRSNGTGVFLEGLDPSYTAVGPIPPAALVAALNLQHQLDAQYGKGRAVSNNPHPGDRRTHYYLVNKTTWNVTDQFQIKNIVSYTYEKDIQYPELDGSSIDVIRYVPLASGAPYLNKDQITEELQFNGKALQDAMTWTIGGYWDRQQPKGNMAYGVLSFGAIQSNVTGHIQSEEWAGYVSSELDLSRWLIPGLKINGGIRKTWDSSEVCHAEYFTSPATATPAGQCIGSTDLFFGPVPAVYSKVNFHKVTYEIGASYQATPDVFLYVSLRAGYRPGSFNLTSIGQTSYGSESLQEFEVGAKTDWHLGQVKGRTNIALFHDRLSNAQRNVNFLFFGVIQSQVVNAATAHIQGVELENTVQLTPNLQATVNWSYTDAKYVNALAPADFAAACTVTPTTANIGFCPSNMIGNAPKNQIIGNIDYTLPLADDVGRVSLGMNVDYRSAAALGDYSTIDPSMIIPGYARFDFYTSWKHVLGSRVDVSGFVTNAFDDRSPQSAIPLLHTGQLGTAAYTYNYPRMFGFRVRYSFGAE
jgi:iron complex outermembrane receptor protein